MVIYLEQHKMLTYLKTLCPLLLFDLIVVSLGHPTVHFPLMTTWVQCSLRIKNRFSLIIIVFLCILRNQSVFFFLVGKYHMTSELEEYRSGLNHTLKIQDMILLHGTSVEGHG